MEVKLPNISSMTGDIRNVRVTRGRVVDGIYGIYRKFWNEKVADLSLWLVDPCP